MKHLIILFVGDYYAMDVFGVKIVLVGKVVHYYFVYFFQPIKMEMKRFVNVRKVSVSAQSLWS